MQITNLNDHVKLSKEKIAGHVLMKFRVNFELQWVLCASNRAFCFEKFHNAWKSLCAPFASCDRPISFAVEIWKLPFHSIFKGRWFANGNSLSVICLLPWSTGSNLPFNLQSFHAGDIMRRHNSLQMFRDPVQYQNWNSHLNSSHILHNSLRENLTWLSGIALHS